MKRRAVLLLLGIGALLLLITAIFTKPARAERTALLQYEDTGLVAIGDFSIYYWYPPSGIEVGSLIRNGDFQEWTETSPDHWEVWADSEQGWEEAHLAQMDFAINEDGENKAIGLLVRNVGGEGDYFAGTYQELDLLPAPGHYWLTTHMTMWGSFEKAIYNAVGWYGIGETADPDTVNDWRELSPLPIPCPNALGLCLYIGRYETIYAEPGQFFHLRVGHNFPVYNAWTLFGLDDISLVPATGEVIKDGFWPDGLVAWDPRELR